MQIHVESLNGVLNNSFRSTGASTNSDYALYLIYSDSSISAVETIVFNNASNATCTIASGYKPMSFTVPAGKTVTSVAVQRIDDVGLPEETAFMAFKVDLATPEYFGELGIFSVLDLSISISVVTV